MIIGLMYQKSAAMYSYCLLTCYAEFGYDERNKTLCCNVAYEDCLLEQAEGEVMACQFYR
jgi:hypothetical protein